jgi:UDP-glucose 4-epimerase
MSHKVLVTGGAGFIGSELVRQLVTGDGKPMPSFPESIDFQPPREVIVVDNLVNGKRENLAGLIGNGCRLEVVDICDRARLAQLLIDVDLVFHLACLGVRHSIHAPEQNHAVNATATLQLLGLARAAGVKRFVYVSSSEVYGTARSVPMTELHPTLPLTVYGASKLAGEGYTRAFYQTYGYPTVVVRPFNAFGPNCHHEGDSGEVIPKFMLRCLAGLPLIVFGEGTQTRDFTYVGDTARGILSAGYAPGAIGETINLGNGQEISIQELAQQVAAVVGAGPPEIIHDHPRPGDVLRLYAQTEKAQQLLGFQPQISLQQGLLKLRDWYLNQDKTPQQLLADERIHNWEPGD